MLQAVGPDLGSWLMCVSSSEHDSAAVQREPREAKFRNYSITVQKKLFFLHHAIMFKILFLIILFQEWFNCNICRGRNRQHVLLQAVLPYAYHEGAGVIHVKEIPGSTETSDICTVSFRVIRLLAAWVLVDAIWYRQGDLGSLKFWEAQFISYMGIALLTVEQVK